MKRTALGLCAFWALALLLCGCAGTSGPAVPVYESADHKNIAKLLLDWQEAWNAGDERAVARLYADHARMAVRIALSGRMLSKKELLANLDQILFEQKRAKLSLEVLLPPRVELSGSRAEVAVPVRVSYMDGGRRITAVQLQYFTLTRIRYIWRIKRSRYEHHALEAGVAK